jgi:hypothetical protein
LADGFFIRIFFANLGSLQKSLLVPIDSFSSKKLDQILGTIKLAHKKSIFTSSLSDHDIEGIIFAYFPINKDHERGHNKRRRLLEKYNKEHRLIILLIDPGERFLLESPSGKKTVECELSPKNHETGVFDTFGLVGLSLENPNFVMIFTWGESPERDQLFAISEIVSHSEEELKNLITQNS